MSNKQIRTIIFVLAVALSSTISVYIYNYFFENKFIVEILIFVFVSALLYKKIIYKKI